jgi:hypothetical protein
MRVDISWWTRTHGVDNLVCLIKTMVDRVDDVADSAKILGDVASG